MWGLEGRKEEYVPLWITAEEGPGLRELQPLSSWNVVQLNALKKNNHKIALFGALQY